MSEFEDFNKLVSKANKRYKRLGQKGWNTGAYKKAKATGGKFSARGTYREKAREYKRVKNFLNSKTSTVRGSKKVLNDMLSRTGLDDLVGNDLDTIMTSKLEGAPDGSAVIVDKFFDIASKVDEYLQQKRGLKVSSDEIWRSIHDTYLPDYNIDLTDADPDEVIAKVIRRLHNDYLESHNSNSSRNTWSTI